MGKKQKKVYFIYFLFKKKIQVRECVTDGPVPGQATVKRNFGGVPKRENGKSFPVWSRKKTIRLLHGKREFFRVQSVERVPVRRSVDGGGCFFANAS